MKEHALAVTQENLRTSPSSGQATTKPLLCHPKLPACHSRAALACPKTALEKSLAFLPRSEGQTPMYIIEIKLCLDVTEREHYQ
jgi:hypothetical protein